MNAERLLAHYERIADAPDAIARLRRFVLDLAVRGKLVVQDPNDEPGSELLKRFALERVRLVKAGEIRDKPELPSVADPDKPFPIPSTWEWVRFANIVDFSAGRTPSRNDTSFWNNGDHPWVSIADMDDGQVLASTKETVTGKARDLVFGSEPAAPGTILMSFKLTIGKIARLGVAAFHNEAIISIRPHLAEIDAYLFKTLPQFARQGDTKGAIKGATLNRESISNILFPLPPLAEQQRIVAKIDELMCLCDRLEAAQSGREGARDRLAAATLARLDTPAPETFQADARFALNALPALTARADQIKALRRTILNLAVRGKLVAQDLSDEPASELLERIAAKKERLVQAGVLKVERGEKAPSSPQAPFELPPGWTWARLQSLCLTISDGDHQAPPRAATGVPFLVIGDVKTKVINYDAERKVEQGYFDGLDSVRKPRLGDILYTLVGSFGIPAPVLSDEPFCVQRHIGILRPAKGIDQLTLALFLESELAFKQADKAATGIAQKTVSLAGLRSMLLPVPPLPEQRRILVRAQGLMTLCDKLEAAIARAERDRARLLEALLNEALDPTLLSEAA